MKQTDQYITSTAQLFVCQLMLQNICDELEKTKHYKYKGKMHVKELQKMTCDDLVKHYKVLDSESELGLYEVQRTYEHLSDLIIKLKLKDFARINFLIPYLLDIPESDFSKVISLIESFKAGEVFEASTPELLDNFVKQGRVKALTTKAE